jgi:hypothetical protein
MNDLIAVKKLAEWDRLKSLVLDSVLFSRLPVPIQPTKPGSFATKPLSENDWNAQSRPRGSPFTYEFGLPWSSWLRCWPSHTVFNALVLSAQFAPARSQSCLRCTAEAHLYLHQAPLRARATSSSEYRYTRKTLFVCVWGGLLAGPKWGFTNSQTTSPAGVTSKNRPNMPSLISVFPFGSRCAFEMRSL